MADKSNMPPGVASTVIPYKVIQAGEYFLSNHPRYVNSMSVMDFGIVLIIDRENTIYFDKDSFLQHARQVVKDAGDA